MGDEAQTSQAKRSTSKAQSKHSMGTGKLALASPQPQKRKTMSILAIACFGRRCERPSNPGVMLSAASSRVRQDGVGDYESLVSRLATSNSGQLGLMIP